MTLLRRTLPILAILVSGVTLLAAIDPGAEDAAQNHRDLERCRQKPELHARLRQDAREFLALAPERRDRLVKLDAALHQQRSAVQASLLDTLKRYAGWLDHLPAEQRRAIDEAPDAQARLLLIRELREKQLLKSVPQTVRADIEKQPEQARIEAVRRIRHEAQERAADWQVARSCWDHFDFKATGEVNHLRKGRAGLDAHTLPLSLADLDSTDQAYVQEVLRPLLSAVEWERLEKAQGEWPRFPRVLVELADRHPPALQGPRGPTHLSELPADFLAQLHRHKAAPKLLKKAKNRWPDFAGAIVTFAREHRIKPPPDFWPSDFADLSVPMHTFVNKTLVPSLVDQPLEAELLHKAEGRWPQYPQTIQILAARHYLTVPWQTLPGPRARWDVYRVQPPEVVDGLPRLSRVALRNFAALHLEPEDQAALSRNVPDPVRWQRLTRDYFTQRPEELKQRQRIDALPTPPAGVQK